MQLIIGGLAVPVGCLAPADTRVLLFDQLMEPTRTRVSVGVNNLLEGGVPMFEGQYLACALSTPVVPVREHELASRLAEPWPPVPCSHPRELLLHQYTVDVDQTLICVHRFAVEVRCLEHICLPTTHTDNNKDQCTMLYDVPCLGPCYMSISGRVHLFFVFRQLCENVKAFSLYRL